MENDKSVRVGGDEEDEEEAKMEKFFALIRSFREARNYYKRKEMNELEKKKRSNKKMKMMCSGDDLQKSSCWVPKFEQEDFTREVEFRRPPLVFPSPCNKEKAKKGEAEVGLDLKLAL
ncbi:protein NIM1-INTERACTING 1-like [Corylus avellana]|uniref:protein NIM1-INTERACTING 1-like n=1 Tax=Corylus avellana TaxID=13451 RepID=UPI001E21A09C|nr:protein NIM1-INTERACTING 1-like [Corylus avellana]